MALSKLYNMETVLIILSVVNVFMLIVQVQTYSRLKQLDRKIDSVGFIVANPEIKHHNQSTRKYNYEKN